MLHGSATIADETDIHFSSVDRKFTTTKLRDKQQETTKNANLRSLTTTTKGKDLPSAHKINTTANRIDTAVKALTDPLILLLTGITIILSDITQIEEPTLGQTTKTIGQVLLTSLHDKQTRITNTTETFPKPTILLLLTQYNSSRTNHYSQSIQSLITSL